MPFAIDTISGQREVVKSFEKHYAALREVKFSIDNGKPVQCLKAKEQAKKRKKKRRNRRPKSSDWVHKTQKRVRQIKNSRRGAVDNSEPTSGKGLSQMIISARRRREEVKRREHAHRIRKMKRNMSESHSLSQRRKNYFDSVANPVVLFRRKRRPSSARRGQPECLQASSNFLGPRKVSRSRPQTARIMKRKSRTREGRPKSAMARYRSRQREIKLVDDDVISFQNKIVQTIIAKRMCKEEDILNFLVDEISNHLFLDEEDLLAVAKYICSEFSVGIHKLHLLLSLKLQVNLEEEEEEDEKNMKTARSKEGKAVTIPRPTNDETNQVILASPKKLVGEPEINQDENENNDLLMKGRILSAENNLSNAIEQAENGNAV